MFTRHAAEPVGIDAQVLVDADLSILGAQPAPFQEYEAQGRRNLQHSLVNLEGLGAAEA